MTDVVAGAVQTVTGAVISILKTTASVSHLGELPGLFNPIPFAVLLLGHCLAVAGLTKGRYSGHLLSYVQGFLMAFGGSVASNLFLGNPTANALFQNNQAIALWTVSWWLVNHNPLDLVAQVLDLAPLGIAARTCMQILRAGLLVSQVDAAAKAFPGVYAPAIIAGALAASGGKISTDIISSISGLRTSFEVSNPSYALRSSLVGSVIYYLTVYVLKAFTPSEGHAIVLLAFLAYTLTDDLLGAPYDYTEHAINFFTTITLISGPKRSTRSRGRAAAAPNSAPSTPRSASKARTPRRTRKSD